MEREPPAVSSFLSTLSSWLNASGLFKLGSATLIGGIALALGWAVYHRGAVQLQPFEGADGRMVSLRLSRALEDVALGASSDLDVDPAHFQMGESSPPSVVIPGTGLSFSALVSFVQLGPLAPTNVQGTLAKQADGVQFFLLQVAGPNGVTAVVTPPKPTLDDAVDDAAVELYGTLQPVALASYLFRRDPLQSLALVRETLSNPNSTSKDRAAAYRVWGLVLRDQRDFDGARAKFDESMAAIGTWGRGSQRSRALTLIDIGHAYLWEQRWHAAADHYRQASDLEPGWAAPLNYLGDASLGAGDPEAAIAFYKRAIEADPLYVEAGNGLGNAYASLGRHNDAVEAYSGARTRHLKRDHNAATTYYGLGDALMRLGCNDAAAAQYDRGVALDPGRGAERHDWAEASACWESFASIAYPWHLGAEVGVQTKPCTLAASVDRPPAVQSPAPAPPVP